MQQYDSFGADTFCTTCKMHTVDTLCAKTSNNFKIVAVEPVEADSGYNTENEEEIEVETVEPSVDESIPKTKQESKSTSGEHKRKEYMKKQKYTKVLF